MDVKNVLNETWAGSHYLVKKGFLWCNLYLAKKQSDRIPNSVKLKEKADKVIEELNGLKKPIFDMRLVLGSWAAAGLLSVVIIVYFRGGTTNNNGDLANATVEGTYKVIDFTPKTLTKEVKQENRDFVQDVLEGLEEDDKAYHNVSRGYVQRARNAQRATGELMCRSFLDLWADPKIVKNFTFMNMGVDFMGSHIYLKMEFVKDLPKDGEYGGKIVLLDENNNEITSELYRIGGKRTGNRSADFDITFNNRFCVFGVHKIICTKGL